jgi:hypothetical protein
MLNIPAVDCKQSSDRQKIAPLLGDEQRRWEVLWPGLTKNHNDAA